MIKLLFLIGLHHIGDVWAQPSWLIEMKKKHVFSIYEHVWVWSTVVSLGLFALDMFAPWKFFFLLGGHFIIDLIKYQLLPKKWRKEYWPIYPDQFLHYLQILTVWSF